jgi:hypothetical protein
MSAFPERDDMEEIAVCMIAAAVVLLLFLTCPIDVIHVHADLIGANYPQNSFVASEKCQNSLSGVLLQFDTHHWS